MFRVARRLALGFALAAAVALVPVHPAAADPGGAAAPVVSNLWQAALDWLAGLWAPAEPEPASVQGCKSDQGVCVDPNG